MSDKFEQVYGTK